MVLFCAFTTSAAFAGEQFEVFGVHLDQEPNVIKSKLTEKFGKKWKCGENPKSTGLRTKEFLCGGYNNFNAAVYYSYNIETSQLKFSCTTYGGCGGDDALEQVRRLLEDRWNIKFKLTTYEEIKIFEYETPSTSLSLGKYALRINHKNKNKNNPSFD